MEIMEALGLGAAWAGGVSLWAKLTTDLEFQTIAVGSAGLGFFVFIVNLPG